MDTLISSQVKVPFNQQGVSVTEKSYIQKGDAADARSSHDPVKLLESELSKRLPGFAPVVRLNATEFNPIAVAGRILGFIENAISQRGSSQLAAQNILQHARLGITQGFSGARGVLSSMPLMSAGVDAQFNQTESLVLQGLDRLGYAAIDTPKQQKIDQLMSESLSTSKQFMQSREASFEIVTQDGERVVINYSAVIESAVNQLYDASQLATAFSFDLATSSSATFQFSVQENLDEDKQQVVNDLLGNVGNLAKQFFNGDVQSAFNSAMGLGFDGGDIKNFALSFQPNIYAEVVQSYQRTEQINSNEYFVSNPFSSPAPAVDVISQLEKMIEQTKQNSVIAQPENTIKTLLTDMLDLINQNGESALQSYIKNIVEHA